MICSNIGLIDFLLGKKNRDRVITRDELRARWSGYCTQPVALRRAWRDGMTGQEIAAIFAAAHGPLGLTADDRGPEFRRAESQYANATGEHVKIVLI